MSTRKSNLNRLKDGIGLPTRDISDKDTLDDAPTRLRVMGADQRPRPITYGELRKLGAVGPECSGDQAERDDTGFQWIWRYTMQDYDRQAPVFAQMVSFLLKRTPAYWDALVQEAGADGVLDSEGQNVRAHLRSGFEAYDKLNRKESIAALKQYDAFKRDCDVWLRRLEDSSLYFAAENLL